MENRLKSASIFLIACSFLSSTIVFFLIFMGPLGIINNIRYPLLATVVFYLLACSIEKKFLFTEVIEEKLSSKFFPWILFALTTVCFVRIKWQEYTGLAISGVDFSHIDYAIWSTKNGPFMQIPIIAKQATYDNFFGNHFSPILYVWVAFRYLFDSPITSLIIHAFALSLPILPMHYMAKKQTTPALASVLVMTYIFTGITASTLQFDIHQEAFYPLAFTILLYGLSQPNRLYIIVGFLLAAAIKEDAGLYLFGLGIVFFIVHKKRRLDSLIVGILGLITAYLSYKIFMPMHQPLNKPQEAYYLPMWSHYGANIKEIALTALNKPHWVLGDLFLNKSFYKLAFAWGLLPFFSRYTFAATLPLIVCVTAKGAPHHLGLYYGAVLVPFFFFASMRTVAWLKNTNVSKKIIWTWVLLAFLYSSFVGGSYLRFKPTHNYFSEIKKFSKIVSNLHGTIYIQGGLLPYMSYANNFRRIDSAQINDNADFYVFADGVSTGPLATNIQELKDALNNSYSISYRQPPFTIYKKVLK